MKHDVVWFEIPVKDFDRAKKFYGELMGRELSEAQAPGGYKMAMFSDAETQKKEGIMSGAIMHGEGYEPSMNGTLVYLNAGSSLSAMVGRVETAGGKVLKDKVAIGENGFIAFIEDTEGNKVGLHSAKE